MFSFAMAQAGCDGGCAKEQAKPTAAPTINLRFAPQTGLSEDVHWVYDMAAPGLGVTRTTATLALSYIGSPGGKPITRETIKAYNVTRDGAPAMLMDLKGVSYDYTHDAAHQLMGDVRFTGQKLGAGPFAKLTAECVRFGTFVEYPPTPIAVGDSWSSPPRRLALGPILSATLNPTYALEKIEHKGAESFAWISVQLEIDIVPMAVAKGVVLAGSGTGTGTMKVRVRDGLLTDSTIDLKFNQEMSADDEEIIGYRELTARARVIVTAPGAQVDLDAEPKPVMAKNEEPTCNLALSTATQRMASTPANGVRFFDAQLGATVLRTATPTGTFEAPGVPWVLPAGEGPTISTGFQMPFEGALKNMLTWAATAPEPRVIYLYADASHTEAALKQRLAPLKGKAEVRLVVKNAGEPVTLPKGSTYYQKRSSALRATPDYKERRNKLEDLMRAHLSLCEPALQAYQSGMVKVQPPVVMRKAILDAFYQCGCTTTNLESLEATLYTFAGTPDLGTTTLLR